MDSGSTIHSSVWKVRLPGSSGVPADWDSLNWEELATGDGACPTATDTVRLQYHGTLVDGTVFDSSIDRGMPLDFELSDVIRGWAEGLQQMRVGGKARLTIPSSLGYGQRGMGPVPPKATLIYEVELLAITTVPKLQR